MVLLLCVCVWCFLFLFLLLFPGVVERTDVSAANPSVVKQMLSRLAELDQTVVRTATSCFSSSSSSSYYAADLLFWEASEITS